MAAQKNTQCGPLARIRFIANEVKIMIIILIIVHLSICYVNVQLAHLVPMSFFYIVYYKFLC